MIRPLGDVVFVRRIEVERGRGGVVIPEAFEKPLNEGRVIWLHSGPTELEFADHVIFPEGAQIGMAGDLLILHEADILAKSLVSSDPEIRSWAQESCTPR